MTKTAEWVNWYNDRTTPSQCNPLGKLQNLKFGDIVRDNNEKDSTKAIGVYIRDSINITITLTDCKGTFWATGNDEYSDLEIIGSVLKD